LREKKKEERRKKAGISVLRRCRFNQIFRFRRDYEGDEEHPEDQADVEHVVFGKPDALCPKCRGVAGKVVGKIGDDSDAEPNPGDEQGQVERLFELAIASAVDEEEGEDAGEAEDEQELEGDEEFDRDENADHHEEEIQRGVGGGIDRESLAEFADGAGIGDGQQHGVHAPDGDEQIADLPPTRPETRSATGAFDGVTESLVTCSGEQGAESPEQEGDAPPEARLLSGADAQEVEADGNGQHAEEVDDGGGAGLNEDDRLCAEVESRVGLHDQPRTRGLRRVVGDRVQASAGGQEEESREESKGSFHMISDQWVTIVSCLRIVSGYADRVCFGMKNSAEL